MGSSLCVLLLIRLRFAQPVVCSPTSGGPCVHVRELVMLECSCVAEHSASRISEGS